MANRQIPEERQAAYYFGIVLMIIGFITFLSVFVRAFSGFGDSGVSGSDAGSFGITAIVGMVLIALGRGLMSLGVRGLAGSGIVLDPEKAREDLDPWTRMAGGMVKDAVDEAGIELGKAVSHHDEPTHEDMPFDEKLRRLARLHSEGVLTDEEFEREKAKILDEQ